MTWPPLLVVWLCWGLSYPFMAWTLEAVDLITARLLANAGAGTLLLLLCLRAQRRRILPHREEWRSVLALSLLIMVVFPLVLIAGVMLVGPGQAAILNYTMPLWASLLAVPVLGVRLDRRTLWHSASGSRPCCWCLPAPRGAKARAASAWFWA